MALPILNRRPDPETSLLSAAHGGKDAGRRRQRGALLCWTLIKSEIPPQASGDPSASPFPSRWSLAHLKGALVRHKRRTCTSAGGARACPNGHVVRGRFRRPKRFSPPKSASSWQFWSNLVAERKWGDEIRVVKVEVKFAVRFFWFYLQLHTIWYRQFSVECGEASFVSRVTVFWLVLRLSKMKSLRCDSSDASWRSVLTVALI